MAFDFPSSPTLNQVYNAGPLSYMWNGYAWASTANVGGTGYVAKTGDTMTGLLTLSGDPTSPLQATTKQYSDTKILRTGDTMTGNFGISSPGATLVLNNTNTTALSTDLYYDVGASPRWLLRTANDPSSDFYFYRFNTSGTLIDSAFTLNRTTGAAYFTGTVATNGISTGAVVAPGGATDVSKHLALYGNSYGMSITSNTLNLVANGVAAISSTSAGTTVSGTLAASSLTVAGNLGANGTIFASAAGGGMYMGTNASATRFLIGGDTPNDQFRFYANTYGNVYTIDTNGATSWNGLMQYNNAVISTGATGGMATTGLGHKLEVRSAGSSGDAAVMAFHRVGAFATGFGIDTDNQLKYGGWSAGNIAYKVWHDGICPNNISYLKCTSGLMLQFGQCNTGGDGWVYFPVTYPTAAYGVVVTGGQTGGLQAIQAIVGTIQAIQTNAFYFQPRYMNNGGAVGVASQPFYFMAWGY